jgi:glycerol kinase
VIFAYGVFIVYTGPGAMTHIVAIDQSTSATKAVLFDAAGRVVDRSAREHRQIYPQPGWVEHDAEEIWQNVLAVLSELASRNFEQVATAVALAITNQRETFVVFDKRTGRPLHHAIVWQCRRGEPICQELSGAGPDETVRAKTGLKLDTYFSGPKLKWLIDAKSDIRRQLENGDALLGTMDTYLIYRLTKAKVFATDHTNASRTLLYDIGRLRWDEQLCCTFNVPMRALAEVRESFDQFGATDADGALPKTLCICGVMGDSQASLLAQGCYERGTFKATFGSGTSILLHTGDRLELSDRGAVSAIAWVWQGRPSYALEGLVNYSSATIAWLKDQLGLIADTSETATLAQTVADNGGVYLVPAFSGLGAPYWRPNARAAIVGMSAHSRREHIVRAALESIAYQIRDLLEMMKLSWGVVPQVLLADGGPTCNDFLMQFTADILRLELIVAEVPESSARGAAMAAMLGRGMVASFNELPSLPRTVGRFKPDMEAGAAERLYSEWQIAVERVF